MRRRSWGLFFALVLLFAGITYRIFHIIQTRPAQTAASQNARTVTVSTVRGTIYDCLRRPLVNENKAYYAALAPDETLLATVYGCTSAARFDVLREQLRTGAPAAVRLDMPVVLMSGLRLFYLPERYGERLLAPHVIGYLDNGQQHGVTGIEQACDALLTQYSGSAACTFAVDGAGTCLAGISPTVKDTTGRAVGGVVLTLDKDIQTMVETAAPAYLTKGAVVVLDPYTGAVKAMASYPDFQPATVAQSIQQNNGALVNRALSLYDCGSVFKIIIAAAALESGVSQQQTYPCNGSMTVKNTVFHCHNRLGHQTVDMTTALAQSCNLYFIQLAQQLRTGALLSMANNFGFGRAITLADGIGTATPILPSLAELESSPAALANFSFGQGKLMATPLHVAQVLATVANNGEMPPVHLIEGYVDEQGEYTAAKVGEAYSIVSAATAKKLQSMLRAVVTDGTGKQAQPTVCSAAGKTGTAETGQVGEGGAVVQSWFAGYFPAETPQYVVTVLAEDASNTGDRAAALFCEISNKLYSAAAGE